MTEDWASELTTKLLDKTPELKDVAFRDIMAEALREERERCADLVRDYPTVIPMWDRPGGPPGNGPARRATQDELADAILRDTE